MALKLKLRGHIRYAHLRSPVFYSSSNQYEPFDKVYSVEDARVFARFSYLLSAFNVHTRARDPSRIEPCEYS